MKTVTITLRCPESVRAALMLAAQERRQPLAAMILEEVCWQLEIPLPEPEKMLTNDDKRLTITT